MVPIGAQPGVAVLLKPGWWRAEILRPRMQAGLGRPATLHEFSSRREFAAQWQRLGKPGEHRLKSVLRKEVGRGEGQRYFACHAAGRGFDSHPRCCAEFY
jgi:hypothetical protein